MSERAWATEIKDIGAGLKTIKELGTLSALDFTVVGLGEPREIRLNAHRRADAAFDRHVADAGDLAQPLRQ